MVGYHGHRAAQYIIYGDADRGRLPQFERSEGVLAGWIGVGLKVVFFNINDLIISGYMQVLGAGQVRPYAELAVVQPCPDGANDAVVSHNVGVVAKEHRADRRKRRFADEVIGEGFAPVGGDGKIHISGVTGVVAAVVEHAVEVARDGVNGHPGIKLVAVGGVVVYADGRRPGVAAVSGFDEPDVGICFAVALVAPVDINRAPMGAVAGVAERHGQAICPLNAGNAKIPSTGNKFNRRFFRKPGVSAIERTVENQPISPGPGHV